MPKPATIAIDGPVAVGKNAIGSLLAKRLGYHFVDTGAMYRAITWLALERGLDWEDEKALGELAVEANIELGSQAVFVNGCDVSLEIRDEKVEKGVSIVARHSGVRRALVAKQRQMAQDGQVVMAGRDISTVVLPRAELKLYLTASAEERARRRYVELVQGGKKTDYEGVLAELKMRDKLDSERELAPLQIAPDAKIINTDGLSLEQVLAEIVSIIEDC
jgi:cytidylate kinase